MQKTFHVGDYVVFVASLVISMAIGVYFSLTGGRQRTTKEYLLGDRNLNFVAVALSMLVSQISAITVLGHPAEIYLYGTQFAFFWLPSIPGVFIAAWLWVPLLYPLQFTSINEVSYHPEIKFNKIIFFLCETKWNCRSFISHRPLGRCNER